MNVAKYAALAVFFFCFHAQSAHGKFKILALLPYNGKSHFYFAEVLFEELARRGNDVTVLSHFPKKTPFPNYRDITMTSKISDEVHSINMDGVSSLSSISKMMIFFGKGLHRVCEEGLSDPAVQKLLASSDRYDLLITELFNTDCFLGFVHKFAAPHVAIRTSALSTWLGDRTGSPDHPAYVPSTTSGNPSRMSFLQRLDNFVDYVVIKIAYRVYDVWCEDVARKHFGRDMPRLEDIGRNASLYLVNTHFVHQYAKPLVPSVKEIAGLHVRETKPLPKDLENWISGGRKGLVYLNLGSMLEPTSMAEDKRLALLGAFDRLEAEGYRVLMKWGKERGVEGLPGNVKLTTWAPQNDVLHHPNVKLFITHGGMLGTVEALHAGVPMIAIPFFGDQPTNAALIEERGLGVVLQYADITPDTLSGSLRKVLFDPGYATRAKELSAAFRDRPMPPLEEAVYWIEYVERHKDTAAARLMRSPALDLSLYQYLLLDVLAVLLLGLFLVWLVLRTVGRVIARLIGGKRDRSSVNKKKN